MKVRGHILARTVVTAVLALLVHIAPADAQLFRTWVASNGDDSDPCTRAQPCATFAGAIGETNPGGEINCVDAGEYVPLNFGLNISKPITIDCAGAFGTAGSAFGPLINISIIEANFPNAVVRLRNLTLNKGGADDHAIRIFGGGAEVHIENCAITGVPQGRSAILFAPEVSLDLFVRDSFIGGNAGAAVTVQPQGPASARVSLNNVRLDHDGAGISVLKPTGGTAVLTLEDVQIENSAGIGVKADGAGAFVFLSNSTVTLNGTAFSAVNNGKIFSFGNNTVAANAAVGSTPTALQQQ